MITTPVIITRDETAGSARQNYHFTRVVETSGRIVRAHVVRDSLPPAVPRGR